QRVPRTLRLFLFSALFVCPLLFAPESFPRSALTRAESARDSLSAKERQEGFSRVWKDIADLYYDPAFNGVDWNEVRKKYEPQVTQAQTDTAFYDLIKRLVEELHDAHTRFSTAAEWENREKHQGVSIGFAVDQVEGKTVVTAVTP